MTTARQKLGRHGEDLAAKKLAGLGYTLVERNYRCPEGEIDLVARQGESWVFVEVRARRSGYYGPPEASITPRKRRRLIACAQTYLADHGLDDVLWRIDVAAVDFAAGGRVEIIENAVCEQDASP